MIYYLIAYQIKGYWGISNTATTEKPIDFLIRMNKNTRTSLVNSWEITKEQFDELKNLE